MKKDILETYYVPTLLKKCNNEVAKKLEKTKSELLRKYNKEGLMVDFDDPKLVDTVGRSMAIDFIEDKKVEVMALYKKDPMSSGFGSLEEIEKEFTDKVNNLKTDSINTVRDFIAGTIIVELCDEQ